jgi:hypothetical protein
MRETLLRSEVEVLLRQGYRWTVEYCGGGHLPSVAGAGLATLPEAVLSHVPTAAAARKLAREQSQKTYFYVRTEEDRNGPVLRFEEG